VRVRGIAGAAVLIIPFALFAQTTGSFAGTVAVQSVSVTSDSLVSSAHLAQIQQGILKHEYREDVGAETAERAKYELQKDGYFKAEVSSVDLQILSETPVQRTVAITLQVNEGQQYRLRRITFEHNKAFEPSLLRQTFAISDGDIFDAEKIRIGVETLRQLYAIRGYINFTPVPNTQFDEAQHLITLNMDLDEGRQFKVRACVLRGEWSDENIREMQAVWQPYLGRFYTPDVIDTLHTALVKMFGTYPPPEELIAIRQNPEDHTVDIEIPLPIGQR
jgi:outer membrane protein assembly factor BamA